MMAKPGRPKKNQSPWVKTPEILSRLNCSRRHLYRLREEVLKKGYHYRDIRNNSSGKGCYRWHLDRIEKTLNETPEAR